MNQLYLKKIRVLQIRKILFLIDSHQFRANFARGINRWHYRGRSRGQLYRNISQIFFISKFIILLFENNV